MTLTFNNVIRLYLTEFKRADPYIKNLKVDIEKQSLERTHQDHYNNNHELEKYTQYKKEFQYNLETTTTSRNKYVLKKANILNFNYFVNWGSSYGWLENEIWNHHRVLGIDRSEETQHRNSTEFGKDIFPVSRNIIEYLKNKPEICTGSLFSSVYISTYFTPEYLVGLFKFLYDSGFKYILLFEPFGLSIQTYSYYQMDENCDKNPVIFRGELILHNYTRLLKRAGFKIIEQQLVDTPHPTDPFFWSVYILANQQQKEREKE